MLGQPAQYHCAIREDHTLKLGLVGRIGIALQQILLGWQCSIAYEALHRITTRPPGWLRQRTMSPIAGRTKKMGLQPQSSSRGRGTEVGFRMLSAMRLPRRPN